MSCNGCRVLRKGCSQDCVLRPSLRWIKSSHSQANATLFLAKFYGRAGLINLINCGPTHLRHVTLESLLYEACGRTIDPTHGSVGLMTSGKWSMCQAAVEAVLRVTPLVIQASGVDESSSADDGSSMKPVQGAPVTGLRRVKTSRRCKRSAKKHVEYSVPADVSNNSVTKFTITGWDNGKTFDDEVKMDSSQDSLVSNLTDLVEESEAVREVKPVLSGENETGPDLTLRLNPAWHNYQSLVIDISDSEA